MKRTLFLLSSLLTLGLASAAYAEGDDWDIDSKHSIATFTVKHMMVSNVPGHMGGITGKVHYDGKNIDNIKVKCTLDPSTINTGDPDRDKHLKGADFFDVEKFPTMTYESNGVIPVNGGGFKLAGKLTMHGVTKEVELTVDGPTPPLKDTKHGVEKIGATATTVINRKDYGINYNKALDNGGVAVSDEVKITLDLELGRKLGDKVSAK